jgi:hypothetical protein
MGLFFNECEAKSFFVRHCLTRLVVAFSSLIIIFLFLNSSIEAIPPPTITLQAILSNDTGLLEGKKRVTVRLYDGDDRTAWEEIHKGSLFVNGACVLNLGRLMPFKAEDFDISTPNFRMIVDGEEIVVTLNSQPYAMRARTTDSVPISLQLKTLSVSENMVVGTQANQGRLVVSGNTYLTQKLFVSGNVFVVTGNKVGIGTTNPGSTYNIDVAGSINVNKLYIAGQEFVNAEGYDRLDAISQLSLDYGNFIIADGENWIATKDESVRNFIGLGVTDNPTFNNLYLNKIVINKNLPAGIIHIATTDNALETPSKIDTFVITNNRVGIGLVRPSANFHVSGNIPLIVGTALTPNALVVSSNGSVGINGMPDDNYVLHIRGNVKLDGQLDGAATDDDWALEADYIYTTKNVGLFDSIDKPSGNLHVMSLSRSLPFESKNTFIVTRNRVGFGLVSPDAYVQIAPEDDSELNLFKIDFSDETKFVVKSDGSIGLGVEEPRGYFHIKNGSNDNFVVTNNKIGIGTENVNAVLDVYADSGGENRLFQIRDQNNVYFAVSTNGMIGVGTENPVALFYVEGSEGPILTVTGDAIGIGTSTPEAFLDLNTTNLNKDYLFRVLSDNETKFVVDASGNVGISTENPRGQLQVGVNSLFVTNNRVGVNTIEPKGGFHVKTWGLNANGDYGNYNTLVVTNNRVGIGSSLPLENYVLTIAGNVRVFGSISQTGATGTYMDNDWYIDVGGESVYTNGVKVGIGTSLPQGIFSVVTTDNNLLVPQPINTMFVNNNRVGLGTVDPGAMLEISGNIPLIVRTGVTDNIIVVSSNGKVAFFSDQPSFDVDVSGDMNVKNLYIDNDFFEIGSFKPASKIFIVGADDGQNWVTKNNYGARASLGVGVNDSPTFNKIGLNVLVPLGALHIKSTDNAIALMFDTLIVTNNRVGIGFVTPSARFHVRGDLSTQNFVVTEYGKVGIGNVVPSGDFHVVSNGKDSFVITNNLVSIGDRSPRDIFHINFKSGWIGDGDYQRSGLLIQNSQAIDVDYLGQDRHTPGIRFKLYDYVGENEYDDAKISLVPYSTNGNDNALVFYNERQPRLKITTTNVRLVTSQEKTDLVVGINGVGIGTALPQGLFHIVTTDNVGEYDTFVVTNNKVAIGLALPEAALHVSGDVPLIVDAPGYEYAFVVTGDGVIGVGYSQPDVSLPANSVHIKGKLQVDDEIIGAGAIVDADWLDNAGSFYNIINKFGIGTTTPKGYLHIYSDEDTYDTLVITNNMVGIGTTTPESSLRILPDLAITPLIITSSDGTTAFLKVDDNGRMAILKDNAAYALDVSGTANADGLRTSALIVSGNYPLIVGMRGTPNALVVNSLGRVGIGTSDTEGILHIRSTSNIDGSAPVSLVVQDQLVSGAWVPGSAFGELVFKSDDSSGVGVGTRAGVKAIMQNATGGRANLALFASESELRQVATFKVLNNEDLVGIGITDPTYSLEVSGSIPIKIGTSATPNVLITNDSGYVGIVTSNPNMQFSVSGNSIFNGDFFVRNGKVGISSSNLTYDLEVGGTLNAIEILATTINVKTLLVDGVIIPTFNTKLRAIAVLATADNNFIIGNETEGWNIANGEDARLAMGVGDSDDVTFNYLSLMGLGVSVNGNPAGYINVEHEGYDTFVVTNNRVGIGLESPLAAFHIVPSNDVVSLIITSSDGTTIAMVIATNNMVGIATANPMYDLDVAGTINAINIIAATINVGNLILDGEAVPTFNAKLRSLANIATDNNNFIIGNETEGWNIANGEDARLAMGVGDSDDVTFNYLSLMGLGVSVNGNPAGYINVEHEGYDTFVVTNNRVGIGLESPLAAFHIVPSNDVVPLIITSSDGTTIALVVSRNNKVGIATDNPNYALDVVGTVNATDLKAIKLVVDSAFVGGEAVISSTEGLEALKYLTTENYNFIIGYDDTWTTRNGDEARDAIGLGEDHNPTFNNLRLNQLGINVDQPDAALHVSGNIPFYAGNIIKPYALTVSSNGYVGVGTSLPTRGLDVNGEMVVANGDNALVVSLRPEGANLWVSDDFNRTGSVVWSRVITVSNNIGIGTSSPSAKLNVSANIPLLVGTAAVPNAFTVTTDGKVGVNTYVPAQVFQVVGNGDAGSFAVNSWQAGFGEDAQGSVLIGTYENLPAIQSEDSGVSQNLLINPISGKVGIGTTMPLAALFVSGNTPLIAGNTDNPNAFIVSGNGYVGVGTANPTFALDVNGSINASEGINIAGAPLMRETPGLLDLAYLTTVNQVMIINEGDHWSTRNAMGIKGFLDLTPTDTPVFRYLGLNAHTDTVRGPLEVWSTKNSEHLVTLFVTANTVAMGKVDFAKLGTDIGTVEEAGLEVHATKKPIIKLRSLYDGDWGLGDALGEIKFYSSDNQASVENVAKVSAIVENSIGSNIALKWSTSEGGSLMDRLILTSSGNAGLGTMTPSGRLHVIDSTHSYIITRNRMMVAVAANNIDDPDYVDRELSVAGDAYIENGIYFEDLKGITVDDADGKMFLDTRLVLGTGNVDVLVNDHNEEGIDRKTDLYIESKDKYSGLLLSTGKAADYKGILLESEFDAAMTGLVGANLYATKTDDNTYFNIENLGAGNMNLYVSDGALVVGATVSEMLNIAATSGIILGSGNKLMANSYYDQTDGRYEFLTDSQYGGYINFDQTAGFWDIGTSPAAGSKGADMDAESKLIILNNGYVGMGISTPKATLHVKTKNNVGVEKDTLVVTNNVVMVNTNSTLNIEAAGGDSSTRFFVFGNALINADLTVNEDLRVKESLVVDQGLDISGDLVVAEYISHKDDPDTSIEFEDGEDRVKINVGGQNLVDISEADDIDYVALGAGGGVTVNLNDQLYVQGETGYVGIGTPTPSSQLDIESVDGDTILTIEADTDNDNAGDQPRLYFKQAGGAVSGYVGMHDSTNHLRVMTEQSNSLHFGTNGVVRMTVTANGFVGIGMTNPKRTFEVEGQIGSAIGTDAALWSVAADGLSIYTNKTYDRDTSGVGWERMLNVSRNIGVGIGTNKQTAKLEVSANSTVFIARTQLAQDAFIINSQGEVGVGYSDPQASLHVSGNYPLRVDTDTTENILVVNADGKVGINTNSPNEKLDVQGQIVGGFGAIDTEGTLDWDHSTNARAGNGHTLLKGSATNGPTSTNEYYHPFSFEYFSKDGNGNLTQFAIPYKEGNLYMRYRYYDSWEGWQKILMEDISGKVGIGTISPSTKLEVESGGSHTLTLSSTGVSQLWLQDTTASVGYKQWYIQNNANTLFFGRSGDDDYGSLVDKIEFSETQNIFNRDLADTDFNVRGANDTSLLYCDASNDKVGIGVIDPTAKLQVSGNVRVFRNTVGGYALEVKNTSKDTGAEGAGILVQAGDGSDGILMNFIDGNDAAVGNISLTGSGIAYNDTSDRRLKKNIVDTSRTINDLLKIKVRDFSFIRDKNNTVVTGFIAQELHKIYPEVVTVPTDDGYWMVDYGHLTPLLTKAIQDQQKIIVNLNNRVEELEDKVEDLNNKLDEVLRRLEE